VNQYLAVESGTGHVYQVGACSEDDAYLALAREWGIEVVPAYASFELVELIPLGENQVKPLLGLVEFTEDANLEAEQGVQA
jgi:hypothetical protein